MPRFIDFIVGDSIKGIVGYIALLAYFVVVIGFAKKFIPKAAQAVIAQTKSLSKMATPYSKAIAGGAKERYKKHGINEWHKPIKNKLTGFAEGAKLRASKIRSNLSLGKNTRSTRKNQYMVREQEVKERAEKRKKEELMKGISGTSIETKKIIMNGGGEKGAAALLAATEENQKFKIEDLTGGTQKIEKLMDILKKNFKDKEYKSLKKKFPHIAAKVEGTAIKDIIENFSREDIQGMSQESLNDEDIAKYMTSGDVKIDQLSEFAKRTSRENLKIMIDEIHNHKNDPNRSHVLRWAQSSPGINALGTTQFKDESDDKKKKEKEEEINKKIDLEIKQKEGREIELKVQIEKRKQIEESNKKTRLEAKKLKTELELAKKIGKGEEATKIMANLKNLEKIIENQEKAKEIAEETIKNLKEL
jgi:hypothetical protein